MRHLISSGSRFEQDIGYSRVVVDDEWIFVSGTTGYDYQTMSIVSDVRKQAEQAFKNIENALTQAGGSMLDVVRVVCILPDVNDLQICWPVLRQHLGHSSQPRR